MSSGLPASAEAHLQQLDATLVGPGRAKRELLRELSDHLEDAVDAYAATGRSRNEAADLAVADFGTVNQVAPALQTTLAVAATRRTAILLLAALLPQPFLWDSGVLGRYTVDLAAPGRRAPDGWLYALLDGTVEVGGFCALLAATLTVVATGVGRRWLSLGQRVARSAARFTLATAVLMPLGAGMMLALHSDTTPLLWLLTLLFIGGPMLLAGTSARRTLAACS